ncbi:MAG TPA: porin [Sideroxyarcus sp.]|nr:porin [Sideroxyarcus sp.]
MSKKIIALAVAAAFSAPAFADSANVTVYGQAHLAYDQYSGDKSPAAVQNGGNLAPGASRLGFKGSEDVGSDLKVVYQYEVGIGLDGSSGTSGLLGAARDSYIGVAGGFGTVLAGRLPLANQYANDANFFGGKIGDAGNFTAKNGVSSRISNAVAYQSPKLGGASVLLAYVPNTNQGAATNTGATTAATTAQSVATKSPSYTVRADFAEGGIKAGVSYQNLSTDKTKPSIKIVALGGGYDFGVARIAAQYVRNTNVAQVAGSNQNIVTIGGNFKLGENDAISAQLVKAGQLGATLNSAATGYTVGFDHNLSKRSTLYAAYSAVSNQAAATFQATGYAHGGVGAPAAGEDPRVISVGVIHNF